METRRLILALVAGFAVFFAYTVIYNRLFPPPEPQPVPQWQRGEAEPRSTSRPADEQAALQALPQATRPAGAASAPVQPGAGLRFVGGERTEPLVIGGEQDELRIELTPHGAAVTTIWLTERRKDGKYAFRAAPHANEPYELLTPVVDNGQRYNSYLTHKLLIREFGDREWRLDQLVWRLARYDARQATFSALLTSPAQNENVLRITKTYELRPAPKLVYLTLAIENLSSQPLNVSIVQDGPIGIRKEHLQYDMRSLVWAERDGGKVKARSKRRSDLAKLPPDKPFSLLPTEPGTHLIWTALANKYFAVFTRPLPISGDVADYIQTIDALTAVRQATTNPGDMLARFTSNFMPVAAGGQTSVTFELYAGPKDDAELEKSNPAFIDRTVLGYNGARDADMRCSCCVIPGTPELMKGLLGLIYFGVRNYGVAIIILVLVVRLLLHPLAVYQQKSMYRMQEAQSRMRPKLEALEERYANDKAALNREKMRLMSEEGVNPAGMLVGMLPMVIQMPILIALWVGINTDLQLRHAPFDGWWIDDLSAPDALYTFAGDGLTIPVLSWLPFIGRMFTNISTLNLLPVLMGVSMWLQQRYMPKPAQQARLDAAKKAQQGPPRKGKKGTSPEDQLRQQQMIAYMMSIFFPLMFYYMPSGLNLYWMATNVFGIFESLHIRKQLARENERRERAGPQPRPPKKPGLLTRAMKRIAERAEELQRKADELSDQKKKPR